ncbi:hypothetical protein [Terriglobus sp.]|uniref:hypothetical protein n=1 Tax=Terriglobus sp. TaxID=1889013 RepID=UPI003AFFF791
MSDFDVYHLLTRTDVIATCHRLHYLQMAAEKACKAYLYSLQRGPAKYLYDHEVVEKVVSLQLRQPQYRAYAGALRRVIRTHAYQIDRLAPAVDRIARPDNCEYPWITPDGWVLVPSEYPFPQLDDQDRRFFATLKLLRELARSMAHSL